MCRRRRLSSVVTAVRGSSLQLVLSARSVLVVNGALAMAALIRAADYFTIWSNDKRLPAQLWAVEAALPLWVWSVLLTVGAVCLVVGSLNPPRLVLLVVGNLMLASTFAALGAGVLWQAVTDIHPGGWRTGASLLMVSAVVHFILALGAEANRKILDERNRRAKSARHEPARSYP